jgi:hypothetical protein
MYGDGEVAHGIARHESMSYRLIPSVEIPPQRRKTIERRYGKREPCLTDEDHQKPKAGCRFHGGVGNGIQFQPVGHYCGAHVRFSDCRISLNALPWPAPSIGLILACANGASVRA